MHYHVGWGGLTAGVEAARKPPCSGCELPNSTLPNSIRASSEWNFSHRKEFKFPLGMGEADNEKVEKLELIVARIWMSYLPIDWGLGAEEGTRL